MENVARAKGLRRLDDSDRDIDVITFELEKEDVMKFKPIYEALHGFLADEGFTHPLTKDDKVEDLYWERWTPSGAKEQHMWWRVVKDINPYIRYFVQVNWQTLNITKAEVAYKGKKVNAEKIDCIIRVSCYLQWDINDKFKNSMGWRMKKAFFNKIYAEEIKQKKRDLEQFGLRMQRLIKSYFEMSVDKPYETIFQPPMGYKEP